MEKEIPVKQIILNLLTVVNYYYRYYLSWLHTILKRGYIQYEDI